MRVGDWPARLAGGMSAGIGGLLVAPVVPGRLSLLLIAGFPAAGLLLPDAVRQRRERLRLRRIVALLPDALDLLAVAAEAGRTPAAGFADLARSGDGPLAREMAIAAAEIDSGQPMSAVLRSLRLRVPGSELATLCAAIERSRLYGSPLADQLRRQASALRRDQRRSVEEQAARAAPKIQLVVALVLVPSVLLMIAAALIANADLFFSSFR